MVAILKGKNVFPCGVKSLQEMLIFLGLRRSGRTWFRKMTSNPFCVWDPRRGMRTITSLIAPMCSKLTFSAKHMHFDK